MNKESKISIKKPVSALKKSIKVNFLDFSKALGKTGADIAFGKWDSLSSDGIDALAAIGISTKPGEIAWLLIYRSLLQAMKILIDEQTTIAPTTVDLKKLEAEITTALEGHSLGINNKFFEHPEKSEILQATQQPFIEYLELSGLQHIEAFSIAERLPIYFTNCLHEEWRTNPSTYTILKDELNTPFTQANERTKAWSHYMTMLQKQVHEPMFFEAFCLHQVFVPLRGYYNKKISENKNDEQEGGITDKKGFERVVVDLNKELEKWLAKADKDDAIRLISGGPGSGKSSFAKMFAANISESAKTKILFIPLHHFEPSHDLIEAVGKFVKMEGTLPNNPLDAEHREPRLLLIFDGLDELAMQGKIAERTTQDFVGEVQRKVAWFNQNKTCLQVLISGRELVIQASENIFRKDEQILHVLPYFLSKHDQQKYTDPHQLLEEDQRQMWWKLYGKASGNDHQGLPTELSNENLTEITTYPLLNYLVALSLRRGQLNFSKETNLNTIYADLLTAIFERGWAGYQHTSIQGIDEKDFGRILEEIALATWHGDGRTTTIKDIESHCSHSGLNSLLTRFQSGLESSGKARVTQLLTAFYFRQSGLDHSGERTFEFTHKSFGEYLTAKRLVREVRLISKKIEERKKDPDDGWDERNALHRWALICGPSPVGRYLFKFILDEINLQFIQNPSEVKKWQETFCHLIEFLLRYGMPIERINPRPDFTQENIYSRNSEEALLVILNCCARLTKTISKIEWRDQQQPSNWLLKLCGQRRNWEPLLALDCLSFLDLQNCTFNSRDLWNSNFEESNLKGAYLVGADCRYANFSRTNLENSVLAYSNLEGADFSNSNLENARFEEANLRSANLSGARLVRADFSPNRFYIQNSKTESIRKKGGRDTCLVGANLKGANLSQANLTGTNLKDANLEDVKLEGVKINKTRIVQKNKKI